MKLQLLAIVLCFSFAVQAQDYSYISDKRFSDPSQLTGYTFIPGVLYIHNKEFPDLSREIPLSAGDVTFSVSQNYLYVTGENIEGAYSIASINAVSYGFKMDLMNARNPSIQGHLKVILNNKDEVDAIVFRKAANVQELVYYQAEIAEKLEGEEKEYFTDGDETVINDSTLWSTTLFPFWGNSDRQTRIHIEDSVKIQFIQDSIISKKKTEIVQRIEVSFMEDGEFGAKTPQTVSFPIIKIVEKENQRQEAVNSRYIIEFSVKNLPSKKIYLILNQQRKAQQIEIGETNYLMRGVY